MIIRSEISKIKVNVRKKLHLDAQLTSLLIGRFFLVSAIATCVPQHIHSRIIDVEQSSESRVSLNNKF